MTARAQAILAAAGGELSGRAGVVLEIAHRLDGREREPCGFGFALEGRGPLFAPMTALLESVRAPDDVRRAQLREERSIGQSLFVSMDGETPTFTLSLHAIDVRGRRRHERWEWREGASAQACAVERWFLPCSPEGKRPSDFVAPELAGPIARLVSESPLKQAGAFEISSSPDHLELLFPWPTLASEVPALLELSRALGARGAAPWQDLPIARVSGLGASSTAALVHAEAPHRGEWPTSLAELEAYVVHEAAQRHHERRLPRAALPEPREETREEIGVRDLYDCDSLAMKRVLGPELHYHFGIWPPVRGRLQTVLPTAAASLLPTPDPGPSDEDFDLSMRRAVEDLYPFIPKGGRVYDLGCGWGAPLSMWIRDLGCDALGATNSREQYRYVSSLGLPVRLAGAEHTFPPGDFDCVVMFESLDHVFDKERVLRVLRQFSPRLVLRMSCQDAVAESTNFDGTMPMISSPKLRSLLEATGWRVRHWKDRRLETVPTVAVWHRRLQAMPRGKDRHVETLRAWCEKTMASPNVWARSNPLMEIMAE